MKRERDGGRRERQKEKDRIVSGKMEKRDES